MLDSYHGFSGKVEQIHLSDLIQLACLAQINQIIKLESGSRRGDICVHSGQVIHAQTGSLRGEEAFIDIFQWEGGRFEILAHEEDPVPTISRTWEFLLIEAIRIRTQNAAVNAQAETLSSETTPCAFCGTMNQIQLTDLIQLVCMTRGSYTIQVQRDEQSGSIFVRMGQVCHSVVRDIEGEEAFHEIFQWPEGHFDVLPSSGNEPDSIEKPWEYLLMEALRLRDEKAGGGKEEEEGREERIESVFQKIQKMKVAEKIRFAMTGDKEVRSLLIRDSNRLVQFAIINSPRISDGEVAVIANSKSVDEDVLRKVGANREWMKIYQIRLALAKNPKTPLPIAIKLVPTLLPQDLKLLGKSKAVPNAVALAARRQTTLKD